MAISIPGLPVLEEHRTPVRANHKEADIVVPIVLG